MIKDLPVPDVVAKVNLFSPIIPQVSDQMLSTYKLFAEFMVTDLCEIASVPLFSSKSD